MCAVVECFTNVLPHAHLKFTDNPLNIGIPITSKKPRPNHLGKTAGLPKIRAPPRKQRTFEEL
jgi:hypothetical protein